MTLLRDVRRASARVIGCRPREVVLTYERRGSLTLAWSGVRDGGAAGCPGRDREAALRALLTLRRTQLRARRAR